MQRHLWLLTVRRPAEVQLVACRAPVRLDRGMSGLTFAALWRRVNPFAYRKEFSQEGVLSKAKHEAEVRLDVLEATLKREEDQLAREHTEEYPTPESPVVDHTASLKKQIHAVQEEINVKEMQ